MENHKPPPAAAGARAFNSLTEYELRAAQASILQTGVIELRHTNELLARICALLQTMEAKLPSWELRERLGAPPPAPGSAGPTRAGW